MTDPTIVRALRSLPVPEHGPDFWARLEAELADDAYARPEVARRRRPFLGALAVAAAVAALALVALPRMAREHTATDQQTVFQPDDGQAVAVVEQFLARAGDGDIEGVDALVGPRSHAYAAAIGASVPALLADVLPVGVGPDALLRPYAGPADDQRVVAVRDGDTVVALPTWHDEATDRWFVEPWALDPTTGARITFLSPSSMSAGDAVSVEVPTEGRVRIVSSSGLSALVPTVGRHAGTVPPPDGGEQVVVASIDTDRELTATAQLLFLDPEPASAQGAGVLFMHRWWLGDEEGMARFGTPEAVAQAKALPSNGSRYDRFSCEGAAGSVYCTWGLEDGRRFVLRVANLERPLRVVEFRLSD